MQHVRGKLAFVTGGVSGIGLGICKVLSDAGMQVVATYMSDDHRDQAESLLKTGDHNMHFYKLDVMDRDAFGKVTEEVVKQHGNIHLLCNNAGIGIRGPFEEMEYEDWDWGLGVNLGGVVNGIKTILPKIKSHGEGGHILTISSMSGVFATPRACIYNTAKFAVMGLMETLRTELAEDGIGVSVACPGLVNTNLPMTMRLRPDRFQHPNVKSTSPEEIDESRKIMEKGMDPIEYAQKLLAGIRENRLFIMTHPEFEAGIRDRFEAILASLPAEAPDPGRVEVEQRFTLRNQIYWL